MRYLHGLPAAALLYAGAVRYGAAIARERIHHRNPAEAEVGG